MKKILIHTILVLLFLTIPVLTSPDFDSSFKMLSVPMFQRSFLEMVLLIIFFYVNFFILMPKLFNSKKYLIFGFSILLCYITIASLPNLLIDIPQNSRMSPKMQPNFGPEMRPNFKNSRNPPPFEINRPPEMRENSFVFNFMRGLLPFGFSLLCSSYLFIFIKKREIEMQKNKAELLSLKYQLQPHFLFNILNNIYSMSILKSDRTPDSILKLSNVMRYVVDKSSKDFVKIKEEIAYLEDYIALQLVRTDESLNFSFKKDIKTENLVIAPMILVNFIENAFKYGFNPEANSVIQIEISTENQVLHLRVFNRIVNKSVPKEMSTKIGIKNTLERLNEIYQKKHSINIQQSNSEYIVDLKMNLELQKTI